MANTFDFAELVANPPSGYDVATLAAAYLRVHHEHDLDGIDAVLEAVTPIWPAVLALLAGVLNALAREHLGDPSIVHNGMTEWALAHESKEET